MSDWPSPTYHKPVVSSFSQEATAPVHVAWRWTAGTPTMPIWNANLALYMPFCLAGNFLVRKVFWHNGATVTGNVDMGVYTGDGTRLFSTGSTVQSGASATQSVALGTPYLLTPGAYFFGFVSSSSSATFFQKVIPGIGGQCAGVQIQVGALPLPATMTVTLPENQSLYPLCGITSHTIL